MDKTRYTYKLYIYIYSKISLWIGPNPHPIKLSWESYWLPTISSRTSNFVKLEPFHRSESDCLKWNSNSTQYYVEYKMWEAYKKENSKALRPPPHVRPSLKRHIREIAGNGTNVYHIWKLACSNFSQAAVTPVSWNCSMEHKRHKKCLKFIMHHSIAFCPKRKR